MRRVALLAVLYVFAAPSLAAAQWLSVQSDHFRVIGNAGERQLATVALKLEQFRDVIGRVHPSIIGEGSAPPVVVLVFQDDRSFEPFMPRVNGRPDRVAGFFQSGEDVNYITLTLQAGERAYPAIFHEYSHVLLRGTFADAPVWFNEGLAEYYRTFEVTPDGRQANIGKAVPQHVRLLRSRRMPFAQLFAVDHGSSEYTTARSDRSVLYAQSWAIVHHAFHAQPPRWDALLAFLARVTKGTPTATAFREAYGFELERLERELQGYVQRPAYEYNSIPFSERIITRIRTETTKISDAEAEAWLGDLLAHMNRGEEADARLRKALALDPDLALAHGSLGSLLIRQGRSADGMVHLERAVALGSANDSVYYSYAQALMSRGQPAPENMGKAIHALERALEIRPGFTDAAELLGLTYLAAGRVSDARSRLEPLVRAEPANHRAAVGLVEALLRSNELDAATAALEPVLARATDAVVRGRALALLSASIGLQSRRLTFAAAGLPLPDDPPRLNVTAAFRRLTTGERRSYGIFQAIECDGSGISIVVRTAHTTLRAHAPRLADVDFIAYEASRPRGIRCGEQTPAEVYLTWRPDASPGIATTGAAVAVEILPVGFIPAP